MIAIDRHPVAEMYRDARQWVVVRRLTDGRQIPLSPVLPASDPMHRDFIVIPSSWGGDDDRELRALRTASVSAPETWGTLGEVMSLIPPSMLERREACPAIVVMGELLTIDCSDVVEEGRLRSLDAAVLMADMPTYAEISMSRRGLHVFFRLAAPWVPPRKRFGSAQIELVVARRIIPLTGDAVVVRGDRIIEASDPLPLRSITPADAEQILRLLGWSPSQPQPQPTVMSDEAVVERARRRYKHFAALWSGDWHGYPSASDADRALVGILASITSDRAQIERLWMASGLARERVHRRDYRERVLDVMGAGMARPPSARKIAEQIARARDVIARLASDEAPEPREWMHIIDAAWQAGVPRRVLLLAIADAWGDDVASRMAGDVEARYTMRSMLARAMMRLRSSSSAR